MCFMSLSHKRKRPWFKIALLLRKINFNGLIQCKILHARSGKICPLVEECHDGYEGNQLFSDWKGGLLQGRDLCLVL